MWKISSFFQLFKCLILTISLTVSAAERHFMEIPKLLISFILVQTKLLRVPS